MSYFIACRRLHIELHFRTGWKTRLLLFSRGICRLGSEYITFRYFSRRFFSVLSTLDFGLSNMFLACLYGSWKKRPCSFLRFTCFFLWFSALLRALCFSLRSYQILSEPSFSSKLAKWSCLFRFFFLFLKSFIILWWLFFLARGLLIVSFTPKISLQTS